jgi:hypothetical protein
MRLRAVRFPCPYCGERKVRLSLRRGWWEVLWSLLLFPPFRCRACWERFHHFRFSLPFINNLAVRREAHFPASPFDRIADQAGEPDRKTP